MQKLQRQVGFCLVCGNSVNSDHSFSRTGEGVCHKKCVDVSEA